jgi:GAF domain-containing protein
MTESRELLAVREIAHAFLVAERPSDVQQFALDRVTPLLGASFSLVMELGPDGELLRPVAQHEWPAQHRHWIGALRVRVGDGPSGVAVAERRLVEVEDLFVDESLSVWHDVAMELRFRSIIAAPLETAEGPIGAVAFYFEDATCMTEEQRGLVRVVADQLAAATDKARRVDALRRANAALAEANAELESQAAAWNVVATARDEVERRVVDALLSLSNTVTVGDAVMRLEAVQALAIASREFTDVSRPGFEAGTDDVDPREPLLEAVSRWRARAPMIVLQVEEPTVLLPTVRGSRRWLTRALELAVGLSVRTAAPGSVVRTRVELGRGFLALRVHWTAHSDALVSRRSPSEVTVGAPVDILEQVGRDLGRESQSVACRSVTAIDLPLVRAITERLGGELRVEAPPAGDDGDHTLVLMFPVDTRA